MRSKKKKKKNPLCTTCLHKYACKYTHNTFFSRNCLKRDPWNVFSVETENGPAPLPASTDVSPCVIITSAVISLRPVFLESGCERGVFVCRLQWPWPSVPPASASDSSVVLLGLLGISWILAALDGGAEMTVLITHSSLATSGT